MDGFSWICPPCLSSVLPVSNSPLNSTLNSAIDSSMVSTGESRVDEIANYNTNVVVNKSIAHININSIWNRIDEVKLLLNEGLFHILAISETKSDSTYNSFHLHTLAHIIGYWGGIGKKEVAGCLCTKKKLHMCWFRKLEPTHMEFIYIDVKGHNNSRFIVLARYRSPTKNKPIDFLP